MQLKSTFIYYFFELRQITKNLLEKQAIFLAARDTSSVIGYAARMSLNFTNISLAIFKIFCILTTFIF